MPNKENKILKQAKRSAVLDDSVNVEERRVSICFMTEQSCDNWWIPEVCLCNRENADLTRFDNGIAPVLFNHDRDVIIGKIDKITFENQRANAEIVFDTDEQSEAVFKKVQSGSLRGVSVGYRRLHTTRIDASEENPITFMGRTYAERTDVTTLWELLEISIVSVPADNDTGVGRDLNDDNSIEVEAFLPEEKNINEKEKSKMGEDKKAPAVDVEAERQNGVAVERERVKCIMDMCKGLNIDAEKQDEFIKEGMSVDSVRSALIDIMAERQKPVATRIEAGESDKEKFRSAIVDGMLMGAGVNVANPASGAERFANLDAVRLCEEALEHEGATGVRNMSKVEIVDMALTPYASYRAMGSGAMLGIIEDFANKAVKNSPAELPFIWGKFVSRGTNNDFKENHRYEIGLDGVPYEMAHESAEFKYQEMGDTKVTTVLRTFGKAIKFTREIFINDQLGETIKVMNRQKNGFERLKEIMFFETLVKVPFSAKNKNIVSVKGITAEVYSQMAITMVKQRDVNDEGFVGVAPKYLVAPFDQMLEHQVLIASAAMPGQANPEVKNVVKNIYDLNLTPYLTGDDYYGIADPNLLPGIEYTTLKGSKGIGSRAIIPQAYLGVEYQLWEDFNFNLIDPRAFVKASKK